MEPSLGDSTWTHRLGHTFSFFETKFIRIDSLHPEINRALVRIQETKGQRPWSSAV